MEYGVIMAGGSGTRLWPLSREGEPKQLLPLVKGKSLLQLSFERLRAFLPADRIYVCTGAAHREAILKGLPELPPANLLGEPAARDTANAVGFPAAVLAKQDPDAAFAVVTADHVIEPVETFADCIKRGFQACEKDKDSLVTFGIVPNHGHTGLGYIHRGEAIAGIDGAYRVQAFKEKPDKPTADRYVESGRYYWNSGMFVWRADTIMQQLKQLLPESHAGLTKIADAWGTDQQEKVLSEVYPTLPKISVDYAIMEPASQGKTGAHVAVVEMPVTWLDVGSWPALAETLPVDDADNAVDAEVFVQVASDNNIIVSRGAPGHVVALLGVSDMVIVHTKDATMICPKSEAQRVKELVAAVKQQNPKYI